jgi:hypothetical protein
VLKVALASLGIPHLRVQTGNQDLASGVGRHGTGLVRKKLLVSVSLLALLGAAREDRELNYSHGAE